MSHGNYKQHTQLIQMVRHCADVIQREIGIIVDLQGPKIRIGRFQKGQVELSSGDIFLLDTHCGNQQGDKKHVGIDYSGLLKDVHPGDRLLLDDGRLEFSVIRVEGTCIRCKVTVGGILSDHKGINRLRGGLSAPALTDKDCQDMQ